MCVRLTIPYNLKCSHSHVNQKLNRRHRFTSFDVVNSCVIRNKMDATVATSKSSSPLIHVRLGEIRYTSIDIVTWEHFFFFGFSTKQSSREGITFGKRGNGNEYSQIILSIVCIFLIYISLMLMINYENKNV